MSPDEIRQLRQDFGISRIELAAVTGLTSGLIEQIEERKAVALQSDLERLQEALKRLIQERARNP